MRQIQSTLQLLQAINETQKEAVNQSVISGGSGLERKVLNYEKQVREFRELSHRTDSTTGIHRILEPENVASIQLLAQASRNSSTDQQKVFLQTKNSLKTGQTIKRKKIIIVKKKREADGSTSCERKIIYKDYGEQFASQESKRLKSPLGCYFQGSASRPQG